MYDFLTGQISTMLKIVLEVRMSLWEFYLRWTKWPFFRFFFLTNVLDNDKLVQECSESTKCFLLGLLVHLLMLLILTWKPVKAIVIKTRAFQSCSMVELSVHSGSYWFNHFAYVYECVRVKGWLFLAGQSHHSFLNCILDSKDFYAIWLSST